MVRRRSRRRPSSPEVQTPLNDENLLREILLRLPPQPSSLPRAAAVSKRWRRVVLDASFLRRFRACHRKPPLLGFFLQGVWKYPPSFVPVLDPPNRVPGARFFGPRGFDDGSKLLGCRHGLVLFLDWSRQAVLLWDPVTGHERQKAMLASAKSEANDAFKDGNYLVAAKIYEEAMALDPLGPSNATLLSNSSLCWLRFGNGEKALKDAQVCRMLRPGRPKACYREGTALMLLKGYEKAAGAFLDGLKLEPGNVEMEDGLRKAMESLKISRCSPGQD